MAIKILRLPFCRKFSPVRQWQGTHFPNLSCFLNESVSQSLYCSHCLYCKSNYKNDVDIFKKYFKILKKNYDDDKVDNDMKQKFKKEMLKIFV